ncbi:MAG TPA: hypothetical protein DCX01_06160 [Bacteroidetes bacterium]|nr:hypothetical protein [Bacteroidota bacterium]
MATLTITVTEAVTLGDGSTDRGTTNTQTVTINEVDHRIMDITTTEVAVLKFGGNNGAGTFKNGTVKYLRITNLDSTNFVTLRIQGSDAEYFVKLEPEDHFILGNTQMDAHEDSVDPARDVAGTSLAAGLGNINTIYADADTATCQVEYFLGSTD